MNAKRLLLGAVGYFVVLFVSSGLSQFLPWGVASTTSLRATTQATTFGTTEARAFPPGTFTTARFDEQMEDRVSLLLTDRTVSWIVTRPVAHYQPGAYMAKEAATQAVVAALLTLLLFVTSPLALPRRLELVALAGVAACAATYGQLLNWWGLPAVYGIGVSVNLVGAWLAGGFLVARFAIPSAARAGR